MHVDREGGTEWFCSSMHLKYKGNEIVPVIRVEKFAAKVYIVNLDNPLEVLFGGRGACGLSLKTTNVGRPIISGCEGPTEKLSSFVDKLLQPIAQQQKSYLKNTTDFINFIEKTKVQADAVLVSMDVTSLYTNIPQEEGIQRVCAAYETFYKNEPPIPTRLLEQALRLILQENSFQFAGKNYLQHMGLPWVQKWQLPLLIYS